MVKINSNSSFRWNAFCCYVLQRLCHSAYRIGYIPYSIEHITLIYSSNYLLYYVLCCYVIFMSSHIIKSGLMCDVWLCMQIHWIIKLYHVCASKKTTITHPSIELLGLHTPSPFWETEILKKKDSRQSLYVCVLCECAVQADLMHKRKFSPFRGYHRFPSCFM